VVVWAESVFEERCYELAWIQGHELGLREALVVVEDCDTDWLHVVGVVTVFRDMIWSMDFRAQWVDGMMPFWMPSFVAPLPRRQPDMPTRTAPAGL
jgi:hypothetical protein